jgi:hypothetical protein
VQARGELTGEICCLRGFAKRSGNKPRLAAEIPSDVPGKYTSARFDLEQIGQRPVKLTLGTAAQTLGKAQVPTHSSGHVYA